MRNFFVFIELHSECGGCISGALPPHWARSYGCFQPLMHGIRQFRFYRDDANAAFLPVAGDQSLNPLTLGQVVPMAVALEVFLHETFDGQFYRHRTPCPSSNVAAWRIKRRFLGAARYGEDDGLC